MGPDGRFIRSPSKQKRAMVIESEDSEASLIDIVSPKTPEILDNTAIKKGTFGRGRPKLIRDQASPISPQISPDNNPTPGKRSGPLTITMTNMTDTDVDRAIEDAKSSDQEVFIRDEYGKVFTDNKPNPNTLEDNLEIYELDLASNLSSSTEIETEEKESIRRSIRLTKTNPIIKYNKQICHDYRSYRRKAQFGRHTESSRRWTRGGRQQPENQSQDKIQTLRAVNHHNTHNSGERSTAHQTSDQWRNNRHNRKQNAPLADQQPIVEGGM